MTHSEALTKIMKYCAYQDRCQQEVRQKLHEIGAPYESIEDLICTLIDDNFLDEERFSRSYVRGKFYYKSWGRKKIVQSLKQKGISEYCIKKGLEEIIESDYRSTLKSLIVKRIGINQEKWSFEDKQKAAQFLFNKGYEGELIWDMINNWDSDT